MDKIMHFIMMNIGHYFSTKHLSEYLNKSKTHSKCETIYNYLTYFENACFIHRVHRVNIKEKSILKTNEKFYLTDHGFRQSISDYNWEDIQLIFENIVFMELVRRGFEVTVGIVGKKEIGFIAKKDGFRRYFLVLHKFSHKSMDEEFKPLTLIQDNYPKYLITKDDNEYDYNGIEKKSIINFLLGDWWE